MLTDVSAAAVDDVELEDDKLCELLLNPASTVLDDEELTDSELELEEDSDKELLDELTETDDEDDEDVEDVELDELDETDNDVVNVERVVHERDVDVDEVHELDVDRLEQLELDSDVLLLDEASSSCRPRMQTLTVLGPPTEYRFSKWLTPDWTSNASVSGW